MVPFQCRDQDSCRFVFQNTNNNVIEGIGKDSGDSNNNGLNFGKSKHCNNRVQRMKNELQLNNLASGDNNVTFLKTKTEHKSKSTSCVDTKNNSSKTAKTFQGTRKTKGLETIYENKHMSYESDTDSFGLMSCPSLPTKDNDNELSKSIKIFPRPVRCPVLECRKMVAMDAVMLHFYFDHSKIGRITLKLQTPEQTHIKSTLLSENTQCLAILLLQNNVQVKCKEADVVDSGVLLNEFHRQDCPLLLMAAKVQTDNQKYSQRSFSSSSRSPLLCHVATQTERLVDNLSRYSRSSSSYTTVKDSVSSAGNASSGNIKFEKNEVLVLWLCKLNVGRVNYSITTMNKDKNKGFSYIGEAIHIRDQQDSATMLEQAECLIVRGVAANRLMDEAGKIIVIVNVLDYDTLH